MASNRVPALLLSARFFQNSTRKPRVRIASKPRFDFADRVIMTLDRLEDRELCAELVKVRWKVGSGPAQSEWAVLEDISPSGACLGIEEPIPLDTIVTLQFSKDRCQARIKYCEFAETNYMLGVQFEKGYRWSRRKFKPDHLTQFRLRKVPKSQ